ncbi:MAG: hypothetical protein RIM99_09665 [Cyclobacteriaceae bacterium]
MRIVTALFLFVCLISCDESREPTPETLGYDFYPIQIGQYRIYDVEEINYKLTGFDTTVYQLRETIFDSIVSADQTSYLIRRDKRENATETWDSDSVWMVTKTSNFLSISENNIPFIKLVFPVKVGQTWDGNSLNSRDATTYYYQNVEEAIIDSVSTSNHVRLIIEDIPRNVVNQDERSEIYARGVGLVEKSYLTLNFCTVNCGQLNEIEGGRFLHQVLIEAGNE